MTRKLTLDWKDFYYAGNGQRYGADTTEFDGIYNDPDEVMSIVEDNLPEGRVALRRYIITILDENGIAFDQVQYNIVSLQRGEVRELASRVAIALYNRINDPMGAVNDREVLYLTAQGEVRYAEDSMFLSNYGISIVVPLSVKHYAEGLKDYDLISERGRFYTTLDNDEQVCDYMSEFIDNDLVPRFEDMFETHHQKEIQRFKNELMHKLHSS